MAEDGAFPIGPELWLEKDFARLGAAFGSIIEAFYESDDSNPADDAVTEQKIRAEGLLLEALVARFAIPAETPSQLPYSEEAEDEVLACLRALADQWRHARGARALPEWAALLRADIGDLLGEPE